MRSTVIMRTQDEKSDSLAPLALPTSGRAISTAPEEVTLASFRVAFLLGDT